MRVELLCGKEVVPLSLPDSVLPIDLKPAPALADPSEAVRQALAAPIASPPLEELAAGKRSACVVISDITRPVPNRTLLPPLLQALEAAGIARDAITILIATGMHRPNLGDELATLVGEKISAHYRIVNHYCRRPEDVREVDRIDGASIEINRDYLDAELKILTGLIEPHFYAGYSGGCKAILPGISSFETMKFMHSYRVIDQLRRANCKLDGNLFHEYVLRVGELVGADFILNVVINKARDITGVFAGHYDQAHRAGCAMVYEQAVVPLDAPVDLVITSGGGYPLDATFYQVSKALICAMDILEPGGTIVVACGCEEGLGSEEFCGIMRSNPSPECFVERHSRTDNFVIDQWCAQNIYQALDHAGRILVYSPGLPAADVAAFGALKIDDVQQTVAALLPEHPRAAVVPEGPYVVGKLAG